MIGKTFRHLTACLAALVLAAGMLTVAGSADHVLAGGHHHHGKAQQQGVIICTVHGEPHPWCDTPLDPFKDGDLIRNGQPSIALQVFWHPTGTTSYGMQLGHWELSTGDNPRVLGAAGTATRQDCDHVVIKHDATKFGTTTGLLFDAYGGMYVFSRACQHGGPWANAPPKYAWGTADGLARPWACCLNRVNPPPGSLLRFDTPPAPARAVHTTAAHKRTTVCGLLADGTGAGSAASPRPGTTPWDGEPTQQVGQNDGPWQVCFTGLAWSRIPLKSASSLCYTDMSGTVKLRACSRNTDWQYWEETGTGPGFHLKNRGSGKYLCAAGGTGSGDVVVKLSNCSGYHSTWEFVDPPASARTMALARRCTPQYVWNWHRSSHPHYVQAKITAQCIPNWAIQTKGVCSVRGGGTYTAYSGIVTNEGTYARATCNQVNKLTDQLQYCYVRVRTGSGTWKPWQKVCVPVGSRAGHRSLPSGAVGTVTG